MRGWWGNLSSLTGRSRPASRENELLRHEWMSLQATWETCKRRIAAADATPPPPSADEIAAIDALFPQSGVRLDMTHGWSAFNEAELAVAEHLSDPQLRAQFGILLTMARERSLPSVPTDDEFRALCADPNTMEDRREAYKALLYRLQSRFIETRFLRSLRGSIARRLFGYGVAATALALFVPLLYILYWYFALSAPLPDPSHPPVPPRLVFDESLSSFAMVATFGMLGAYFSRMIAFQSGTTVTFDDAMASYVGRMLRLRMLYGMIGALIFYLMVRGDILGGGIFPKFDHSAISDRIPRIVASKPGTGQIGSITLFMPTQQLAKLLVWSFIAGFSERLVPDSLARVERAGTEAKDRA